MVRNNLYGRAEDVEVARLAINAGIRVFFLYLETPISTGKQRIEMSK